MRFVIAAQIVNDARDKGYAVPAFNANGSTYDIARAALEAAQETGAPLILQSYEPNLEYRGAEYFVKMTALLCDELNITIPVGTTHGVYEKQDGIDFELIDVFRAVGKA